jgi:CubicO group peptidase (beta-lactamase class C family)
MYSAAAIRSLTDSAIPELLQYLATAQPLFPPNTQPSYSNIGYSLLGLALQSVTGVSAEEYISSHILAPLNMSHSSFTAPPLEGAVVALGSQFAANLSSDNP